MPQSLLTMNRTACLIFNPVAGQSDPEQDLFKIQTLLEPEFDLDIRLTTKDIGANQLAREALEQGAAMIIASGGDGTLSEAAEALVGTNIPLGIISRGTANAFAAALEIPNTIEAACQTILGGATRVVDAAMCNGKPMVLLVGIGFEAEAIERADRETKNRWGTLAYLVAGLQQLRDMEAFEAEIETDDKRIVVSATAITVANAAPPTSILAQGPAGVIFDDGLLDLTVVAPATKAGAIASAYHLLQTALNESPAQREDIGYLRTRRVKITTHPPQKVVQDGELLGTTPIEVECIPGGLTLLVPRSEELLTMPLEQIEGLPNVIIEPL